MRLDNQSLDEPIHSKIYMRARKQCQGTGKSAWNPLFRTLLGRNRPIARLCTQLGFYIDSYCSPPDLPSARRSVAVPVPVPVTVPVSAPVPAPTSVFPPPFFAPALAPHEAFLLPDPGLHPYGFRTERSDSTTYDHSKLTVSS